MTLWIILIVAVLVLGAVGSVLSLMGERTKRQSHRDRWQSKR
jgi:hypothetical protein